MLSPFLKKLLFVRQFFMSDGRIEILGQKHFMLPLSVVGGLQHPKTFDVLNKEMNKVMDYYAKKAGTPPGGMIKYVQDLYETMGLGKLQVIKLDSDKKQAILRVQNINLNNNEVVSGVLAGLFSFVFKKKIAKKNTSIIKKLGFIEVSIK